MNKFTEEHLLALKALRQASEEKINFTIQQQYEKAAYYRDVERKIVNDLGEDYDYIKNQLLKDIDEIENYLKRKDNLNNLLDES